jgi:hypothetical protein
MSTYNALELHIFWVPRPQGIIRAARSGFHEQCLEVGFVSPVARQLHNVDQIKPPAGLENPTSSNTRAVSRAAHHISRCLQPSNSRAIVSPSQSYGDTPPRMGVGQAPTAFVLLRREIVFAIIY